LILTKTNNFIYLFIFFSSITQRDVLYKKCCISFVPSALVNILETKSVVKATVVLGHMWNGSFGKVCLHPTTQFFSHG